MYINNVPKMSQNINFSLFSQNAHALRFMCKQGTLFMSLFACLFIIVI